MPRSLLTSVCLLLPLGCGPTLDSESDDDAATSGPMTDTASDGPGVGDSTGAESSDTGSTGTDTDAPSFDDIAGQWECSGFVDVIVFDIVEYQAGLPSVEGRACSVSSTGEPPLEGDNCGELTLHEFSPPVNLIFVLPYPAIPSPLEFEFIGGYDPNRELLGGVLYPLARGMERVDLECRRHQG